jgi:hypothetical protein
MASELKVNKITPESGVTLTLGDSGDTINFGSGVLPNFENLTVTGDLTVDTNSLKVDSTNNRVGIGTTSPSSKLDVNGTVTATAFSGDGSALTGVGTTWESKSADFFGAAGTAYFVDTSSNAITATLPASPSTGDEIRFLDVAGTFDTNNLTVARNGNPIQGDASDLTVSTERAGFALVYYNGTQGWLLKDV